MMMKTNRQALGLGVVSALVLIVAAAPSAIAADDAAGHRAFFAQHCVKCHGPDKQKAKVRLDTIGPITDKKSAELWENVLIALEDGEMPPEDEPAVKAGDRQRMIAVAKRMLAKGLSGPQDFPRTPVRRMNRFQYNNAVVDLLELKVDLFALPERMIRDHSNYFDPSSGKLPDTVKVGSRPLGKSQLVQRRLAGVAPYPQDLRAEHGFDNRADHLSLSPLLMESFLKLSRSIVESRDFGPKTCGAWGWLFQPPASDADLRGEARDRLRRLLTRAFRRTVADDVLDRYTGHVVARVEGGDSFTDGMKLAVSAVLASPRFLYLYDRDDQADAKRDDDFDLASRLSFFLWGSIPDEQLMNLAAQGRLSDPDVLGQQVDRMLNDRKIKRFCDAFPAQWLQLEQLISSKPRGKHAQHFYSGQYRMSMQMMMEPLLLFEAVLVEDRPIAELIDPPFSYRSALLQQWMTWGKGSMGPPTVMTFKRVPNEDRREGGVITNPAVLTMTSGAERTKPITRGAWIATVIFNNPPEPPPADVPPLPEKPDKADENLTLRERLDAHRQRADCKGCHAKIDPFGFALENYDPTGRWRDTYENGRNVDATGVLFRKHKFANPVEFKDAILVEKDRFTRALAKHLLSFALGREVGVTDSPALDKIVKQAAADDGKLRTLIRQVALSEPFLQRRQAADSAE